MWKHQPVIGGNVGGIKVQIEDKENGFLVNSPKEAAERAIYLLENPEEKETNGPKSARVCT
jgi:trehalose synthase